MKNISWTRILITVNCLVNAFLIWAIIDLYRLNDALGASLVFWSTVLQNVFHLSKGSGIV